LIECLLLALHFDYKRTIGVTLSGVTCYLFRQAVLKPPFFITITFTLYNDFGHKSYTMKTIKEVQVQDYVQYEYQALGSPVNALISDYQQLHKERDFSVLQIESTETAIAKSKEVIRVQEMLADFSTHMHNLNATLAQATDGLIPDELKGAIGTTKASLFLTQKRSVADTIMYAPADLARQEKELQSLRINTRVRDAKLIEVQEQLKSVFND
jgi:hypothetical protein